MPAERRVGAACLVGMAAAAACALCGCRQDLDANQARLCRLAAVALAEPTPLSVQAQASLALDAEGRPGVRIELGEAGAEAPHWIECRFPAAGQGAVDDLQSVDSDRGPVPVSRLFFLKRYWLPSVEAAAADPVLRDRVLGLATVPTGVAYGVQQLLSALPNAAIYSLLAAAYSLVYGLNGRIILAFGDLAGVGGASALIGVLAIGSTLPPLILAAAGVAGLWTAALYGGVIERLVLWPLRGSTGQQGLVATIGVALVLEELMRLASRSQSRWITPVLDEPLVLLRSPDFVVTITPVALLLSAVALAASLGVLVLLRVSGFGRAWRAASDDALAAALFGIDPKRLAAQTFALACALAGLAGAAITVSYGSVGFGYATTLGIKALIAAILGGIGSVPGAFLGGIAIAVLEAGWSAYFPGVYRDLVVNTLLVLVLMFRPGGFLGYRDLLPRRI